MRRFLCLMLFVFVLPVRASDCALPGIKLLALGAEDNRIVLQMPDRSLHEMAVGDQLPGTEAHLLKLLQAAAVFELAAAPGKEGQIVRLNKGGATQCFLASAAPSQSRPAPQSLIFPTGEAGNDALRVGKTSH